METSRKAIDEEGHVIDHRVLSRCAAISGNLHQMAPGERGSRDFRCNDRASLCALSLSLSLPLSVDSSQWIGDGRGGGQQRVSSNVDLARPGVGGGGRGEGFESL